MSSLHLEEDDSDVHIKIAQLLLKAGADIKAKNKYGETMFSEDGLDYYPDSPVMNYLFKVEMRRIVAQNIQKNG